MPTTNTPSESPSDATLKMGATTNPSATTKDKSNLGVGVYASVLAVGNPAKQQGFTPDEQRLLNEAHDLVTAFGVQLIEARSPLDGAVKIKLPNNNNYILVHGELLGEKSDFCLGTLAVTMKKRGAKAKELSLPSASVTTLAYFLKWIYKDTLLTSTGATSVQYPERKVTWPDLVNIWLFAGDIDLDALQNHAVDILVLKMLTFLELDERTESEIDLIRAAFNLLWRGKNQAQNEIEHRKSDKPLRALMMDWFANPLYQTKANVDHLWAGGLSRSFYRDYALHVIEQNFSGGGKGSGDKGDGPAHLKAIENVSRHTLAQFWQIKPEKYHVH